jgi:hypothetical protein
MPDEEKPPKDMVFITRESAARGQLDSAILLWFLGADVAAIHTLSIAAQKLLHDVGKKVGKPSENVEFIYSLPQAMQDTLRAPQNFFKHGSKDPNAILGYRPSEAELCIIDSIVMYDGLYGRLTVFMKAFALRFALEEPELVSLEVLTTSLVKGVSIDGIAELDRAAFFNAVLKRLD